jgi:hypothetical protein
MEQQIQCVMNNRLESSSEGQIKTAVHKWWLPFLAVLSTSLSFDSEYIPPGHIGRGAIMAGFAIFMAMRGLRYGTVQGYVWAVREHHIRVGSVCCDPLDNVVDWTRFMSALEVQTWVDSTVEPREMVPFQLFTRTLRKLDHTDFHDLGLGTMMLMCYFTMSRSETPVPKRVEDFKQDQHIRVCDCRLLDGVYVEWGFGAIKQDRRSKRARKDPTKREWKPVGEAPGILSMRAWTDQYKQHAKRLGWHKEGTDPFFVRVNGECWVYQQLLDAMRAAMAKCEGMNAQLALRYGLHGLRVLGYNCWRAANGEEVAKLQGGWGSDGHRVYARDTLQKILSFASLGAKYAASHALPPMPLDAESPDMSVFREAPPDRARAAREAVTGGSSPAEPEYVIDRILDRKGRYYLVSWAGYDDSHNTWEPYANLRDTVAMDNFNFLQRLRTFGYEFHKSGT